MMNSGGFNLPKGYTGVTIPRLDPQQKSMLDQLMQSLSGGTTGAADFLKQLASGNPSAFEGRERQAYSDFEKKTLPSISQYFANQGMLGSSSYQGAMGEAGRGLVEGLANQRQDLQHQGVMDLLNLFMTLANNPTNEYGILAQPKKNKMNWGSMLGSLGGGLGGLAGLF